MTLVVYVALLQDCDWAPYAAALGYLARHQDADGSWGRPPAACRCGGRLRVEVPAPDPALAREIDRRVRELGADEHAIREAAVRALVETGPAAVPGLREAEASGDAEVRARASQALRGIARREQAPAVKPTAWALIAFVHAGYSHVSQDVEDGIAYGSVVRRAASWLEARQKADGAFALEDEESDLTAALALAELYGLTGSEHWKDATDRACRRALGDASGAPRVLLLKSMVRRSAELSDLTLELPPTPARLRESVEGREDAFARAARVLALAYENRAREAGVDGLLALDPSRTPPEELCLARWAVGLGAMHVEGVKLWRNRTLRVLSKAQRAGPADCDRGSWTAADPARRVEATALLVHACDPCGCKACNNPFFRK